MVDVPGSRLVKPTGSQPAVVFLAPPAVSGQHLRADELNSDGSASPARHCLQLVLSAARCPYCLLMPYLAQHGTLRKKMKKYCHKDVIRVVYPQLTRTKMCQRYCVDQLTYNALCGLPFVFDSNRYLFLMAHIDYAQNSLPDNFVHCPLGANIGEITALYCLVSR